MRFLFLSVFFLGCLRASLAQNDTTTIGTDEPANTTLVSTTVSAGYPTTSNESQPTELPFSTSNTSTGPLNTTTQPTEPQSTSVPINGTTTVQTMDSPSTSQGAGSVANPSFNVASFVGGMALIVALQGIAFFAYKFYKSRSSNYQHLGDTDTII